MSFLCRNILSKLEKCVSVVSRFSTISENQIEAQKERVEPIISTTEAIEKNQFFYKPRQVWLESLKTIEAKKLGLVYLHPDIFAAQPRVDIIHENIRWQQVYRYVVSYYVYTLLVRKDLVLAGLDCFILFTYLLVIYLYFRSILNKNLYFKNPDKSGKVYLVRFTFII